MRLGKSDNRIDASLHGILMAGESRDIDAVILRGGIKIRAVLRQKSLQAWAACTVTSPNTSEKASYFQPDIVTLPNEDSKRPEFETAPTAGFCRGRGPGLAAALPLAAVEGIIHCPRPVSESMASAALANCFRRSAADAALDGVRKRLIRDPSVACPTKLFPQPCAQTFAPIRRHVCNRFALRPDRYAVGTSRNRRSPHRRPEYG
jgi:hypothetical protein